MAWLGLDLSLTATGFFLLRDDGSNKNCEINTDPKRFPSLIKRVSAIADKVVENLDGEKIDLVLMEDYYVGQFAQSVITLSALGTMVRHNLLKNGYRYITAKPATIKKFESGSGASKKGNMIKDVFKHHGFDTSSDNIADACAMAYFCKAYWDNAHGDTDFTKAQLESLKVLGKTKVEEPY